MEVVNQEISCYTKEFELYPVDDGKVLMVSAMI